MVITVGNIKELAEHVANSQGFFAHKSNSAGENAFIKRCRDKRRNVHRPSWPDYLLELNGELVGVEVKAGNDKPSANQIRTFDLLVKHKVMAIYIWQPKYPKRLSAWPGAKSLFDNGERLTARQQEAKRKKEKIRATAAKRRKANNMLHEPRRYRRKARGRTG